MYIMKTILVVQPHSFVDVITNSSTELFVCGKDMSLDIVQTVIAGRGCVARGLDSDELFYVKNKDKIKKLHGEYGSTDHYIPDELIEEARRLSLYVEKEDEPSKRYRLAGYAYISINRYWYMDCLDENSIIVQGDGDNSIDWDDQDEIEDLLSARRFHLW